MRKKLLISIVFCVSVISLPLKASETSISNEQITLMSQRVEMLENTKVNISSTRLLKDVNGNENYILGVLENNGYIIASKDDLNLSEYCIQPSSNPYKEYMNLDISYAGPSNYIVKENNSQIEIKTQLSISDDIKNREGLSELNNKFLADTFDDTNARSMPWIGIGESRFPRYATSSWINDAAYYGGAFCGPFAAAIMLAYYEDYINSAVVPSSIRSLGSTKPGTLIDQLILLTPAPSSTLPTDIYTGVKTFLERFSSDKTFKPTLAYSTWDAVVKACTPGRPICVGLLSYAGSTYGNHWVTVYQAHEDNAGKGFYKCVDNWGGYNKVINTSWTMGAVGLNK